MKPTHAGFERALAYLCGDLARRFDGQIRDYAPQRLSAYARPFAHALLPLAVSSRVWRTGRLDGPAGVYGHVPMSISFITQPAMNLLRTLDAAVATGDFSGLEKIVERAAGSWRELCECVCAQVELYEANCRLAFGRNPGRPQSIVIGRVQVSDAAFRRILRALRSQQERQSAESMYRVYLVNKEII